MSYSKSLADDFLKMPETVLVEVTERMKVGQVNAGSASQGDGSAQSKTSSKTDIPNGNSSDKKESGGASHGEPKSNSSRHWMTAFYIVVAGIAVYAIYKNYKANSIVKPPFRNPDGSFNRDSLFMSPVFITGKQVLKWVTILLGVAVLLWGLNKVMSQIKILEKNTFA